MDTFDGTNEELLETLRERCDDLIPKHIIVDDIYASINYINCVANGKKPVVNVGEAYLALQVVDAIERSMKEGKEVTL